MIMHFAKLVWAFDIRAPEDGKLPIDTKVGWTEGILLKPKELKVNISLREQARGVVIKSAYKEADEFLRQFE